jgi:hypothetical protein
MSERTLFLVSVSKLAQTSTFVWLHSSVEHFMEQSEAVSSWGCCIRTHFPEVGLGLCEDLAFVDAEALGAAPYTDVNVSAEPDLYIFLRVLGASPKVCTDLDLSSEARVGGEALLAVDICLDTDGAAWDEQFGIRWSSCRQLKRAATPAALCRRPFNAGGVFAARSAESGEERHLLPCKAVEGLCGDR